MRRGSGAASCRRLVERWRRGRAGSTRPRSPASVMSWSSSPIRSSSSPVSRPSPARASRSACASARSVTVTRWSSVAASGSMTGSWSRCQPSRHCAARRIRARSAHDGQTEARVCPHGMRTCSTWPVSMSVRRSWTGRRQAPCSAARSLTTVRASGSAIRSARVVRAAVTRHRPSRCLRYRRARRSRTGGIQRAVRACHPRPGSVPCRRPGTARRYARLSPS